MKETDKEREERYRRKPRLDKLGIKPDSRVAAIAVDDEVFLAELKAAVANLSIGRVVKDCDAIFYGVTKEAHLPRLAKLKHSLKSNGAIWVIRPKGRDDLTESMVLGAGRDAGMYDVKTARISATHTGLKFVIPVADRG